MADEMQPNDHGTGNEMISGGWKRKREQEMAVDGWPEVAIGIAVDVKIEEASSAGSGLLLTEHHKSKQQRTRTTADFDFAPSEQAIERYLANAAYQWPVIPAVGTASALVTPGTTTMAPTLISNEHTQYSPQDTRQFPQQQYELQYPQYTHHVYQQAPLFAKPNPFINISTSSGANTSANITGNMLNQNTPTPSCSPSPLYESLEQPLPYHQPPALYYQPPVPLQQIQEQQLQQQQKQQQHQQQQAQPQPQPQYQTMSSTSSLSHLGSSTLLFNDRRRSVDSASLFFYDAQSSGSGANFAGGNTAANITAMFADRRRSLDISMLDAFRPSSSSSNIVASASSVFLADADVPAYQQLFQTGEELGRQQQQQQQQAQQPLQHELNERDFHMFD
ncbi:hypothetical protein HK100_000575 [Physocladia obscura]|uniref:Uncharacterized protein n=1 Tax=Physocladia obscura TaxID=109957 RepID=A0AAD5SZW5_9FUNG|nr:hypothetical protein HK100_000575 [Physocladia obscura]